MFIEQELTHTKGKYAGQPFDLLPFQRKIVRNLYGTKRPNGKRRYTSAYVEIPKKNGKTELGAALALYGLCADDESGAEVYSAASTRDQAGLTFRVAAQMVRNSLRLSKMCRIKDSTKTIFRTDKPDCFYRAISADAGTQDGINPSTVIFDELHRQRNRDLFDIFKYGMTAREEPMLFMITTAGVTGESPICEEQHDYARRCLDGIINDRSFYPVIYGLGEGEDWENEGEPATATREATGWYKANPALGHFLPIERIREEAEAAKEAPTQQNSFRRFRLNQWVGQETRFLPMNEWSKCGDAVGPHSLAGTACYGGLDLSTTRDLTAFELVFPIDGYMAIQSHIFLPSEGLRERCRRDNVPYDLWAAQGYIHLTPGNQVDYDFVRETILSLAKAYNILEIGYDRWNAAQIVTQLAGEGLTMVPIGQGYQTMNAPTSELLSLVMSHRLRHGSNPVLTWMADCMTVDQDAAGNMKPAKPDRMKSKKRIDGMVAIINALARQIVQASEPEYQCIIM